MSKLNVSQKYNINITLENYVLQENSLDKMLPNTYPNKTDINDILIKASYVFVELKVNKHKECIISTVNYFEIAETKIY